MPYCIYPVGFLLVIKIFVAVGTGVWHSPCHPAAVAKGCAAQGEVQHTLMKHFENKCRENADE